MAAQLLWTSLSRRQGTKRTYAENEQALCFHADTKQAIDYEPEADTPSLDGGTPHDTGCGDSNHSDAVSTFAFTPDPIMLDSDGYAPSFTASQAVSIQAFFKRYGVVIIRDVLSSDQVDAAASEVFRAAGLGNTPPQTLEQLERVDWDSVYGSRYNRSKGFVGYEAPNSECAWRSRLAPALHHVYSTLFGRKDLMAKLDRFGMMRPTVFDNSDGNEIFRKDWQTTGEWIHWDQNPWLEPEFVRIQGVLALSDHTDTTGGFHCIPSFCAHWQAWAAANEEYRMDADLVAVPTGDSMRPHLQRLPMRPGSVCLWDSRTPHGNFPNEGRSWRVCQYVGFHPAPHPVRIRARAPAHMQLLCRANCVLFRCASTECAARLGADATGLHAHPKGEQSPAP